MAKYSGDNDAHDEVNSFQHLPEARQYMRREDGVMEKIIVPEAASLNVLHLAVVCALVSQHCSPKYHLLDAMCWLWARGLFVSLRDLISRRIDGPTPTKQGASYDKMGRLVPNTPRLITENADVSATPQSIKELFSKFSPSETRDVCKEDVSALFRDGFLVKSILAEFDTAYEAALAKLNVRIFLWQLCAVVLTFSSGKCRQGCQGCRGCEVRR